MDMEAQIVEALRQELQRQCQEGELRLGEGDGPVSIEGKVDLEALAMAVVGRVAGGP